MRGIQGSFHFAFCKIGQALILSSRSKAFPASFNVAGDCSDVNFVAPVTIGAASFWIFF